MRKVLTGLLLLAATATTPAYAHAHLKQAAPAVGSTISPGPSVLRLGFSEGIELAFSRVTVTMDDGMAMQPASVTLDPNDKTVILVRFSARLEPGHYAVTWHVVSVDTHKTQGHYGFTIKP